jgi:hypothetical protein
MPPMDVVPATSPVVNSVIIMEGSISDDIIASLLLPMPPKVLPVSRP